MSSADIYIYIFIHFCTYFSDYGNWVTVYFPNYPCTLYLCVNLTVCMNMQQMRCTSMLSSWFTHNNTPRNAGQAAPLAPQGIFPIVNFSQPKLDCSCNGLKWQKSWGSFIPSKNLSNYKHLSAAFPSNTFTMIAISCLDYRFVHKRTKGLHFDTHAPLRWILFLQKNITLKENYIVISWNSLVLFIGKAKGQCKGVNVRQI